MRAAVVVDDVGDNRDAAGVAGVDQLAQGLRVAVGVFEREQQRGVVAHRALGVEVLARQQLDRVDAEVLQVVEAQHQLVEPAGVAGHVIEGADVDLVDYQLVPVGHAKVIGRPVEGRVAHDRIAAGVGGVAAVRVHLPNEVLSPVRLDDEAIFGPVLYAEHERRPVRRSGPGVAVALEPKFARLPRGRGEVAGDVDLLGEGRPHPERAAFVVEVRPHPRQRRRRGEHGAAQVLAQSHLHLPLADRHGGLPEVGLPHFRRIDR